MEITVSIPTQRIVDLFIVAIESGDPVTTASKGACFDDVQRHVESLIDAGGKSKEGHFTLPRLESGRYVARGVVVEPSHA